MHGTLLCEACMVLATPVDYKSLSCVLVYGQPTDDLANNTRKKESFLAWSERESRAVNY